MNSFNFQDSEENIYWDKMAGEQDAENLIFNPAFSYPNAGGDFPMGWQKGREGRNALYCWPPDDQDYGIIIKNRLANRLASIIQQRLFYVPVCEKQVWEAGAVFYASVQLRATIKIHFISSSSSRILSSSMDFAVNAERGTCSGLVTVPAEAEYACIEVGTRDAGSLWIEKVIFKRIFPRDRIYADARGRLNVNGIETIKKIVDPVQVEGFLKINRENRNIIEDVITGPEEQASGWQDVFSLITYSFIVINEGPEEAILQIQYSPDQINWCRDCSNVNLDPGEMRILVSMFFVRYIRLAYHSPGAGSTRLRIFFQGQG